MKRFALAVLVTAGLALPALAEQKLTARQNGTVRIAASSTEVTRISVVGDRVRRIIKDQSHFQEMNDETTGDVFLRYAGAHDKLSTETGYILTENGATISYELTPRQGLGAETVVITINGVPDSPGVAPSRSLSGGAAQAFQLAAGEGGGGHSSTLVAFTRAAIDRHIAGKAPPRRSHGSSVASESGSGMRARVLIAAGGRTGRYVRPQDFYGSNVLAVWVQRNNLGPNERAWVIVVEKR